MDTRTSQPAPVAPMAVEQFVPEAKRRDGDPFTNLVREHGDWLERECEAIAQWVAAETGTKPEMVRLSPAWLGEDRRVGVLVFRASISADGAGASAPVCDWWIVQERSGQRWLYPCLISTAGDMVRYHHQIRTVQLKK